MLLKWLFTFLAIVWLVQTLRPYFNPQAAPNQRRPPTPPPSPPPATKGPEVQQTAADSEGEYIDFEEIK